MRILFTSMRQTGHFQPMVSFILACRRAGHEVFVSAANDLAERAKKTGAEFIPFSHPGDAGLAPLWAKLPGKPPDEQRRTVLGEIFADAVVRPALPDLLATVERLRPDAIVRESQEWAGFVVAEKARVPCLRIAITAGRIFRETIEVQTGFIDGHRKTLGLPLDPSGDRMVNEPALTQIPEALEFPGVRNGRDIRRFRDVRREAVPLPDWWSGSKAPLVYVTLGTVTGDSEMRRGAFRKVAEATFDLPVRVLLTTGVDPAALSLGDLPPNVHVERFVPQDDVFPHAAATVCHGGMGTTLGALAAGTPLVVTPMFADQPDNAERVTALGAGVGLPLGDPAPEAVRAALRRVLEEPSFREGARRIAAEIARLPPMEDAVAAIEQFARC